MPEARRIRAEADGGPLGGGAPRAVWLTLGSPAGTVSVQSAAERLVGEHRPCHLIWDPATGEMAQLISVLRAGRALGAPDRLDWAPNRVRRRPENVNAEGRVCVQIGVLALASEPFTGGPMVGVDEIMNWLDSWGVARRWPSGQPAAWPDGGKAAGRPNGGGPGGGGPGGGPGGPGGPGGGPGGPGGGPGGPGSGIDVSRAIWARGGHFGASQVPGCGHAGPGAIDIHRLTGNGSHHGLAMRNARNLSAAYAAAALPVPA